MKNGNFTSEKLVVSLVIGTFRRGWTRHLQGYTKAGLSSDVASAGRQRDLVAGPNLSDCNHGHIQCGGAVSSCRICDDALWRDWVGGLEEIGVAKVTTAFEGLLFAPIMLGEQ